MDIFAFHFMPWPHLPPDYEGPAWVTCPNSLYDPQRGHSLYNRYLDELEYAEELGFDGVSLNEHHQTAYGGMPSPNLIAAALSRRTTRLRIAVMGCGLPLYGTPLRVAEEYAMLDVITGGRLVAGMVIAGGPEYYAYGMNPTEARRRFNEALDLILQAWTRPGPFEFDGEFYKHRYVNPWPRPLQQPHPPIWVPGAGSVETMALVSRHGFGYSGIPFFHRDFLASNFALFRKTWLEAGRPADPSKLAFLVPVYVAESDEAARREYESAIEFFRKRHLVGGHLMPPGYASAQSVLRMMGAVGKTIGDVKDWKDLLSGGFAIAGSPKTVIDMLSERMSELGAGKLFAIMHMGNLSAELTRKNFELFASEVMPTLRREFPDGARWPEAGAERRPVAS